MLRVSFSVYNVYFSRDLKLDLDSFQNTPKISLEWQDFLLRFAVLKIEAKSLNQSNKS